MFRIGGILRLSPVNVETYSNFAALDFRIWIVIEPVSSGMSQYLVMSRYVRGSPNTRHTRSKGASAITWNLSLSTYWYSSIADVTWQWGDPGLIESYPDLDPVSKLSEAEVSIGLKPELNVLTEPASLVLEGLRQVPVVQGHSWLYASSNLMS